ncbi:MAG TPA: PQQ-binding-like beta-propeller repeat protein [Pirellulaceae bacterium]|jgi:outer membrane protein assembly factor BamB|nr:PQQ-binding-like beta-propeller repeat protein [Pirellulaceae bacterium]
MATSEEADSRRGDWVEMPDGTLKRRPRRAYAALLGLLFFSVASAVLLLYAEPIRDWGQMCDTAFVHVAGFVMGVVALLFLVNVVLIFLRVRWVGRLAGTLLVMVLIGVGIGIAFGSGKWDAVGVQFDGFLRPSLRWSKTLEDLPGAVTDEPVRPVGGDVALGEEVRAVEHDRGASDGEAAAAEALAGEPEWPGFLGPDRDGATTDPGLATDWESSPPELLWKRDVGEGWSSFAVWGSRFFTQEQRGPKEYVACYDLATGDPIWGVYRETRHAEALGGVGPRATPTLADGRVYAAGATGDLLCLDPLTGAVIWSADVREMVGITDAEDVAAVSWGRAASPLVVDGKLYIPGGGREGERSLLLCLDAATGEVVWKGGDDQISYVSPTFAVIDEVPQVLAVGEKAVYGFAADSGQLLWQQPWQGSSAGDATCSQPHVLPSQRVMISKGYGYGALCFRVAKVEGTEDWIADPIWSNKRVLGTKFTNFVVLGEHAYGLSDGILQCVAVETGKEVWRDGRYGHGQVLLVGDLLLIQGEQGEVALVEATPDEFREFGRFQALEGKTWNNPVLVGDRLLVRNSAQMAAYRLPLKQ